MKNVFFSTTTDMTELYKLDLNANKEDKIILINEIQEAELSEKDYIPDSYQKCPMDNLSMFLLENINYRQNMVKKQRQLI